MMHFVLDSALLAESQAVLNHYKKLYWLVGGAGSGKSTIGQALATKYDIPVYDMDAHIYGAYHGRFSATRHPVNHTWASAENGFAWLLNLSWEEFNQFNQAVIPEYLDLLREDLANKDPQTPLLVDGGICNPAILAQVLPTDQIICLATTNQSSREIWESNDERLAMKEMMQQMPNPEATWQKFLQFDTNITQTILSECQQSSIFVCRREKSDSVATFATKVATKLEL